MKVLNDLLCEYLPWDSGVFGLRIGRIKANRLSPEAVDQIKEWCLINQIDCLYFLADSDDNETISLAEKNQFHLVDICLTLERQLSDVSEITSADGGIEIRQAEPDDIKTLRAVAKASHHDSRFYYDPKFDDRRCDELYETWIEKSCRGYADIVFVAALQEKPVGYITCHIVDEAKGRIGLFAIGPKSQGKGIGRQLINRSLSWCAACGLDQVSVVTQGRNHKAQRLYQSLDFRTKEVGLWYHSWFSSERE